MTTQSFQNFLLDTLTRSFENKDWITEEMSQIDESLQNKLCAINKEQQEFFFEIYNRMKQTLSETVSIQVNSQQFTPDSISYHKKFGWVLESTDQQFLPNEARVFLGKLSLLEKTKIQIGKRSYISGPAKIRGGGKVEIGLFCSMAENLMITTHNDSHPMNHPAMLNFKTNQRMIEDDLQLTIHYPELTNPKTTVSIGNDVWIGRNVLITKGVNIGDGCVIAQDSLVRKDCEPYGIYAGTPAKLIRHRFSKDTIHQLSQIQWWNWPINKFKNNEHFFSTDLTAYDGNITDLIHP